MPIKLELVKRKNTKGFWIILCASILIVGCVCAILSPGFNSLKERIAAAQPTEPKYGIEAFSTTNKPFMWQKAAVTFSQRTIGELNVPSGKLVAGDAFFASLQDKPLDGTVTAGKYPVILALANYKMPQANKPDLEFKKIALAKVTFNNASINAWKYAGSYPVDSGTWNFCDFFTAQKLKYSFNSKGDTDLLLDALGKNSKKDDFSWANLTIAPGCNQISFNSGDGDGSYASFWGLDANGKICALVSDFDLFYEIPKPAANAKTVNSK